MKRIIPLLLLTILGATGCAKKAAPSHPGSISTLDSWSYDVLLVEQASINAAKAQFTAGTLPVGAKEPLSYAIAQYNVAQAAWQTYHASGVGSDALQQAINALVGAVGALQQALGAPAPKPLSWINPGLAWRVA